MIKRVLSILAACFFIVISGCAIQPKVPLTYNKDVPAAVLPSDELENRLLQYWSFRSLGNFEEAYKMEAPYIRELISSSTYANLFAKGAAIDRIEILQIKPVSNRFYQIKMKLFYPMNDKSINNSVHIDGWVKPEKTWFHMKKDPVLRNYFP